MSEPVDIEKLSDDAMRTAAEVLESGVLSYSRGSRSQTHLDPRVALEAGEMARRIAHNRDHGVSSVVDMRFL